MMELDRKIGSILGKAAMIDVWHIVNSKKTLQAMWKRWGQRDELSCFTEPTMTAAGHP